METLARFFHRTMSDSTIESVCMRCFQTIAKGKSEFDVREMESVHSCVPLRELHHHLREARE
jgi:hypothetical protein